MRAPTFLLVCTATSAFACSDPQCRPGEVKIGTICHEREMDEEDAASTATEDAGRMERSHAEGTELETDPRGSTFADAATDGSQQVIEEIDAAEVTEPAVLDSGTNATADAQAEACVATSERCDDEDNDCDDKVDEGDVCKPACTPTKEVCNQKDDDCDGKIDEDPPTWYPDCDLDGAPSIENALTVCTKPSPADCTSWTDQRPAVGDCNDRDKRYSPNIPANLDGTNLGLVSEASYSGDMDCDGVVERNAVWEEHSYDGAGWVWVPGDPEHAMLPICPEGASACSETLATRCVENLEDPGKPVGCGLSELRVLGTFDSCTSLDLGVRVVCW